MKWMKSLCAAAVAFPIAAHSGDYLGDFCWLIDHPNSDADIFLTLGINDMGGGHYWLGGRFETSSGTVHPISGNAEYIRGAWSLNLSFAYIQDSGSNPTVRMRQMRIDLTDGLNGEAGWVGIQGYPPEEGFALSINSAESFGYWVALGPALYIDCEGQFGE
jgi:hypothetical protein